MYSLSFVVSSDTPWQTSPTISGEGRASDPYALIVAGGHCKKYTEYELDATVAQAIPIFEGNIQDISASTEKSTLFTTRQSPPTICPLR